MNMKTKMQMRMKMKMDMKMNMKMMMTITAMMTTMGYSVLLFAIHDALPLTDARQHGAVDRTEVVYAAPPQSKNISSL